MQFALAPSVAEASGVDRELEEGLTEKEFGEETPFETPVTIAVLVPVEVSGGWATSDPLVDATAGAVGIVLIGVACVVGFWVLLGEGGEFGGGEGTVLMEDEGVGGE